MVDEEEHVEPTEEHRVDAEEVAGEPALRLRCEELRPGWPLRGEGSTSWRFRISQTLKGGIAIPIVASSPWIRP